MQTSPYDRPAPPSTQPGQFYSSPPPVAALYTLPNSIYLRLGLDCWDIKRDARNYAGPGPVIAHPPCGHWGRYSKNCKLPGMDCGPIAVDQVRKFGGILEHPTSSNLWHFMGCTTEPGQKDLWGGQCIRIHQWDWGHLAEKDTLLYIVGIESPRLPPLPACAIPGQKKRPLQNLSKPQRQQTPIALAIAILCLASQVTL